MADWRQIQARIRKAKNSAEAPAKLLELYRRTRDAMVAWELAAIEEKAEHKDEAVNWYTIAARRFRRADWKKKAEEALARLGVEFTPETAEAAAKEHEERILGEAAGAAPESTRSTSADLQEHQPLPLALGEIPETPETGAPAEVSAHAGETGEEGQPGKKKRRRGRRGGRGRRRKGAPAAPGLPSQVFAGTEEPRPPVVRPPAFDRGRPERAAFEPPVHREAPVAREYEAPAPLSLAERASHGRAGDPALASRMAHLESMLRRLVSSPLHRMDKADEAPAGPGVLLLSDSDLITTYYIEACQTLRVGFANLLRGGKSNSGRGTGRGYTERGDLKAKLAEHLGISEAKVTQYMKDHCVVRWIQLDDEAPLLAHFAIGVLRAPLNLD
ncbi:MAG: hypothetical protein LAN59_07950 [Acidobacteriia bacterium]|nr:hypothetical protein [Terriglobia bacterium]